MTYEKDKSGLFGKKTVKLGCLSDNWKIDRKFQTKRKDACYNTHLKMFNTVQDVLKERKKSRFLQFLTTSNPTLAILKCNTGKLPRKLRSLGALYPLPCIYSLIYSYKANSTLQ